ncbi:hypothetical protein Y032_0420g1146 [Ancylostoma ceylanicum]|uniref:5'-nucleotidase n=2 Tax=Ancylostoma ceylanicum TaxID=53326 RepID=A0A016X1G2_9BILA|nr:hypothetical protein Y032_0420g1146 [Ancylostoma ceylanicum]
MGQTGENYGKSCHPPDVVVKTCQKADNMDKTIDEESVYSMAPQALYRVIFKGVNAFSTHLRFGDQRDHLQSFLKKEKLTCLLRHSSAVNSQPHRGRWTASHGHIVSAKFDKPTIEGFVRNSKIILRDHAEVMMQRLRHLGIPLVVFSAGIGNIIEIFLQQKFGQMPANVHIISNMMNFNEQGIVVSFSQPLIHTFCKNSSVVRKESEFFHEVNGRTNVILLGDSVGDIHMDVGVEKEGPTLKIGFLNSDVDNLLEHYLDVFDVVLVRDQSMQIPDAIVQAIAEGYLKFT